MSQVADPGASGSPSSFTVNYDALLTTTLYAYRPKMVDNIFKANAFLAALKRYDGIEYQDGGERVAQPLMYEENGTFDSYRGYDILDTTPQDGMTTAFYEWSEIGGTISISRREERQNSGEAAILKLLEKKIMQAEMSIKSKTNNQLVLGTVSSAEFVPGNGAKDLLPLGYFLPKDNTSNPASGGNVGNISRTAEDWWRPRTAVLNSGTADTGNDFAVSVSTYAGLRVGLYRMYNYCTRGADGSAPNLVLSDQVTYETYENSLDQLKRYGDEELATMGFDNIKLKGATMIWDELVPDVDSGTAALTTGTAFFLNTRFYKLVIDSQTDFVTTPFIEPENQTAKTAKVLFMGQSTVSNYRKHGVCYAIAQDIAA
jgi:hypothetical protein